MSPINLQRITTRLFKRDFKEKRASREAVQKSLLEVLSGKAQAVPPVWLMRQAGRYLPEYQVLRREAKSFLDLCLTPKLAAEITLQPIRRFRFDAAILFADILLIPYALGQSVRFETGHGPQLDPINDVAAITRVQKLDPRKLAPVYETVGRARAELPADVTLLGFCGAPWTVATYMIGGVSSPEQEKPRMFAYRQPKAFAVLIDILIEASVEYLARQLEAGADAVQIFDSWAGVLPADEFERWAIEPVKRIIEELRRRAPGAKVIAFPRGAGSHLLKYAEAVPADAISIDWSADLKFVREHIQSRVPVQGNLDPLALLAGGPALDRSVDAILAALSGRPFIFNLGHGVLPGTPLHHVERMLNRVRGVA